MKSINTSFSCSPFFIELQVELSQEELQRIITEAKEELGYVRLKIIYYLLVNESSLRKLLFDHFYSGNYKLKRKRRRRMKGCPLKRIQVM